MDTSDDDDIYIANNEDEIDVQLAEPWDRVFAVIIDNILFNLLIRWIPDFFTKPTKVATGISILLGIIYLGANIYFMTKDGQTIGKKIMRIKVITMEGENPGFWRYVILREGTLQLFLYVMMNFFFIFFIYIMTYIALTIMMFRNEDHRTLQDYIANTVVIEC